MGLRAARRRRVRIEINPIDDSAAIGNERLSLGRSFS
jgi:hypothetical protein